MIKMICGHAAATSKAADRKGLVTVQAELALRGYELHELANGALLVLPAGQARHMKDVAAAQKFGRAIGIEP